MTKVTYHAPEGDSELVRMGGVRFIDGEAVDLAPGEHARLIGKLFGNPHFEVELDPEAANAASGSSRLRAVHRGRGVYGITDDGALLDQIGPLTKDDADAFNAMTDAEKVAFVDKPADPDQ